ncbi:MAG: SpoIIE family protein phosphatase [Akkermansia sp.]|nr:SpoIIE family protein phosphatase [Akkermansia sp.]MBR2313745.1 SpoIIE family protein phosphatase [Akkermansia sp.]
MSDGPEQNNEKRTVPGVFVWDMVRKALRAAEEGVYCWLFENDEIFYTEQCVKMMGMSMKDWAPNIFTEPEKTIHPEDVSFFTTTVKRYIDRPTYNPLRVEVRLLNQHNRGWRWVRINGLLEYDADKKPCRLVGVWVDITRRKMADLHAMEDRDLFRTLINYLPDNIYFKNRESRFVIANEATAKKMKVRTPSDLIGSRDSNFFAPEMCEIARTEEAEIMATGKPILNRIHHEKWKGGKSTWGRVSKFPWYAADGSVKGIVGISSDVTKLIETQQKYQRIAKQLDEKNKLLEKEITLAREVQQALQNVFVPDREWKHIDGSTRRARFHHVYLPSAGVAGDCFEVFPVGQSGVGMLICDVMGHGVRAALIASMMRGLMAQLSNLADTPALFLSSLNRQMYRIFSQANITMFASACYVYLDLDRRRLTLAGAGHPAPIVLPRDARAFQPAIPRTPALGLLENAMFRESEIRLEDGMKLMLFTDGLTEAQDATGDELGAPRIMDFLQERQPRSIREMIDIALAGMHQFTGSVQQDDDICLLGVEFNEE